MLPSFLSLRKGSASPSSSPPFPLSGRGASWFANRPMAERTRMTLARLKDTPRAARSRLPRFCCGVLEVARQQFSVFILKTGYWGRNHKRPLSAHRPFCSHKPPSLYLPPAAPRRTFSFRGLSWFRDLTRPSLASSPTRNVALSPPSWPRGNCCPEPNERSRLLRVAPR